MIQLRRNVMIQLTECYDTADGYVMIQLTECYDTYYIADGML